MSLRSGIRARLHLVRIITPRMLAVPIRAARIINQPIFGYIHAVLAFKTVYTPHSVFIYT